jgi:hypothetical protein
MVRRAWREVVLATREIHDFPPFVLEARSMKRMLFATIALLFAAMPAAAQGGKESMPFNGKDLTGWKLKGGDVKKSRWQVGTSVMDEKNPKFLVFSPLTAASKVPEMVNDIQPGKNSVDISTDEKYGDAVIDLELMVSKGSNSGIYVMGEYEVQVFDSYGKEKVGPGDLGGLYGAAAPRVNAAKKPGEWQRMIIDYQAPKFDAAGKKTSNMKIVKITLNDQIIHENVEMKGPTPTPLTGREAATGPIMFQGDHGPVSYRNIRVTAK